MKGLYIHVPFCAAKCDYCAFYSAAPLPGQLDAYVDALVNRFGEYADLCFDTVYFGGGTPSLLGGERIKRLLNAARERFVIDKNAEITVECNPSTVDSILPHQLAFAGVNRISMGLQSATQSERQSLRRRSSPEQVMHGISQFQAVGITNVSLDLMLALPNQTKESLNESIDFVLQSGAKHVSAYILSVEEGTPLFERKGTLNLPNDDETADLYLHAAKRLCNAGFEHYEVSNFARPGFESRHNLHYWRDEEYLGLGPAAHSFLGGRRFYFEPNTLDFINGRPPVQDGSGGSRKEYVMLALRLAEGLHDGRYFDRFGVHLPPAIFEAARPMERSGLVMLNDNCISLTSKGFLLSNSIIIRLIEEITED